ncbi:hypothetical protein [Rhizobium leguminosarum]|uniref:hypothetical protein n=1 Tax=Rhizobium leguminosarum TaxID=384 RepID=UPI00143F3397|nr:hypothetical protein [Rhizobium leguminosarum]NKL21266.1 hypothetical protein [Rhizobium leguminosarum bv. viciae]
MISNFFRSSIGDEANLTVRLCLEENLKILFCDESPAILEGCKMAKRPISSINGAEFDPNQNI